MSGSSDLSGDITVNGNPIAIWTLPAGSFYAEAEIVDPRLFYGAQVFVNVNSSAGYATWGGLEAGATGAIVR